MIWYDVMWCDMIWYDILYVCVLPHPAPQTQTGLQVDLHKSLSVSVFVCERDRNKERKKKEWKKDRRQRERERERKVHLKCMLNVTCSASPVFKHITKQTAKQKGSHEQSKSGCPLVSCVSAFESVHKQSHTEIRLPACWDKTCWRYAIQQLRNNKQIVQAQGLNCSSDCLQWPFQKDCLRRCPSQFCVEAQPRSSTK